MKSKLSIPLSILAITLFMACSNDPKSSQEAVAIDSTKIKDSLAKSETNKIEE
ncbi:hypothetical protein [Pedobacter immunditicola]|uniref:hypothetical protein n=1 Tax=Pedobacter immunditicola TaxID=3133440 RepID=UPI0030AF0C07